MELSLEQKDELKSVIRSIYLNNEVEEDVTKGYIESVIDTIIDFLERRDLSRYSGTLIQIPLFVVDVPSEMKWFNIISDEVSNRYTTNVNVILIPYRRTKPENTPVKFIYKI